MTRCARIVAGVSGIVAVIALLVLPVCAQDPEIIEFETLATVPVGDGPLDIKSADFDEDGRPDLVVTNVLGDSISVILNDIELGFQVSATLLTSGSSYQVALADFDGDGHIDIASVGSADLQIFDGLGDGTFEIGVVVALPNDSAHSIHSADFNNDGLPDVAVGESGDVLRCGAASMRQGV